MRRVTRRLSNTGSSEVLDHPHIGTEGPVVDRKMATIGRRYGPGCGRSAQPVNKRHVPRGDTAFLLPEHVAVAAQPCPSRPLSARLNPCVPLWARIVANNNRKLCGSLHQLERHAQCLIKLTVFRCAESVVLPYSVLMNCITRGFYSFRKFREIEFDDNSVVQLLPVEEGTWGGKAVTIRADLRGVLAAAFLGMVLTTTLDVRGVGFY